MTDLSERIDAHIADHGTIIEIKLDKMQTELSAKLDNINARFDIMDEQIAELSSEIDKDISAANQRMNRMEERWTTEVGKFEQSL